MKAPGSIFRQFLAALTLSLFASPSAFSQGSYEILHDTLSATGWFGGDNTGGGPRDVGVGQSVLVDTSILLTRFSFYFDTRFDYVLNPDGFGHEVVLVLNIRDSSGALLQAVATQVSASFEGGWVTWTDINMNVDAGTLLIFTTYLAGAYDLHQYTSSQGSDQYALYTPGDRYSKEGTSDAEMELWTDWSIHPWDSMFWLEGTIQTVAVEEPPQQLPHDFALLPAYPNPFNPKTAIRFEIRNVEYVVLRIYDLLGREIATLVNEEKPSGRYEVVWDARLKIGEQALHASSGIYIARLAAGGRVMTQKLVLLK